MLNEMAIWNQDSASEPQVAIQYRSDTNWDTGSDNQPLANIIIDTPTRKNTVVRKSDIAIATDTRTLVRTIQAEPRPMKFVACKTVGEYNRKKEKIGKFCLDEQKAKEAEEQKQSTSQQDTRDKFNNIPNERDQPGPSKTNEKQKKTQRKANTKSPKRKNKPTKRTTQNRHNLI